MFVRYIQIEINAELDLKPIETINLDIQTSFQATEFMSQIQTTLIIYI